MSLILHNLLTRLQNFPPLMDAIQMERTLVNIETHGEQYCSVCHVNVRCLLKVRAFVLFQGETRSWTTYTPSSKSGIKITATPMTAKTSWLKSIVE
jgi:hypothetical protein